MFKLSKMEESFQFFDNLRNKMLEESQVKIAIWWRRKVQERLEREERERAEQEKKRANDKKRNKQNAKNQAWNSRSNQQPNKYQNRGPKNKDLDATFGSAQKDRTGHTDLATMIQEEKKKQAEQPVTNSVITNASADAAKKGDKARFMKTQSFSSKPITPLFKGQMTTDSSETGEGNCSPAQSNFAKQPNVHAIKELDFMRAKSEQPTISKKNSRKNVTKTNSQSSINEVYTPQSTAQLSTPVGG